MEFDKGRAKPTEVEDDPDSLESMMLRLAELKLEVKDERQKYLDKTKNQREMIKSYEAVISEEVRKLHKTVTVGKLRAEYKSYVKFQMKKDENNEA